MEEEVVNKEVWRHLAFSNREEVCHTTVIGFPRG